MRCWAFPDPERQVFDQVVLMGYRKADPVPDAHAEGMALEWAVGEPEPLRSHPYTDYSPETTPSGDILFTTRTVDPVAAAAEARRSGLWASTEITDTLWPARDARTRPLMPLRRGHMAMLVAAGFLDNLCLEAEGTSSTSRPSAGSRPSSSSSNRHNKVRFSWAVDLDTTEVV